MLWRRTVHLLSAEATPTGAGNGTAAAPKYGMRALGSLWATRPVLAVPNAWCLHSELNVRGVPMGQWHAFLHMQLARLSPFEVTQSHVELHGQTAKLWYWNGAKTSSLSRQSDSNRPFVLPEAVVRQDGQSTALRAALSAQTALGAWWWQKSARPTHSGVPWMAALALLGVCGMAGFLGFHAYQWQQSGSQIESTAQQVRSNRQRAVTQLAAQKRLDEAQANTLALKPYQATPVLGETMACAALVTSNGGLMLRDMDIRAGGFSAALTSLAPLDLDDAGKALAQCKLLTDLALDPGQDSKSARVTARIVQEKNQFFPRLAP